MDHPRSLRQDVEDPAEQSCHLRLADPLMQTALPITPKETIRVPATLKHDNTQVVMPQRRQYSETLLQARGTAVIITSLFPSSRILETSLRESSRKSRANLPGSFLRKGGAAFSHVRNHGRTAPFIRQGCCSAVQTRILMGEGIFISAGSPLPERALGT